MKLVTLFIVGLVLLVLISLGCEKPAPKPEPKPSLAEKKHDFAGEILISMYSHRDGLRKQDPKEAVTEAKAVAEEFFKQ
jgi:hypothetical protein